jgi:formiminotetrahydrofolate cyclodeaminase
LLKDLKITEFLEKTASGDPVPGGGSAAALNAALAASLSEMVANLTIGKKRFEAVEDEMKDIAAMATLLRKKLLEDIDNDSEAYQKVMAAFQFPKDTEEEKKQRTQAIQDALKKAALVPLSVAEDALKIMALAENVIKKGNPNAATDGAVGAMMARTAALAALYNVKINLSAIKDKTFVKELNREVESIESQIKEKEKTILTTVDI